MAEPAATAAARVLAALGDSRAAGDSAVVLIDGCSGAGKSTLADEVVAEWRARRDIRPVLLRLEHVYPGWDGLAAASGMLVTDVLLPLAESRPARITRWDWAADAPGAAIEVPAGVPLVVEGSGAITRASRPYASLAVWVELDAASRYARAMLRDGETYRPHWDRWATQERAHACAEHPRALADLEVDGATLLRTVGG